MTHSLKPKHTAPRHVDLAETITAFNDAVECHDYQRAVDVTEWLRHVAKKAPDDVDRWQTLKAAIIAGRLPKNMDLAEPLRRAAQFGDEVPPVILLYLADVLAGQIKHSRQKIKEFDRPGAKAKRQTEDILFVNLVGNLRNAAKLAKKKSPFDIAYAQLAAESGTTPSAIEKEFNRAKARLKSGQY